MRRMTQAQSHAKGLVTPSLSQLWLMAMLRAFGALVLGALATLQMRPRRARPVIGTRTDAATLPREKTSIECEEISVVGGDDPDDDRMIIMPGSGPQVRIPREGGDPAITLNLVPACSFRPEQVSPSALGPRLREGHGVWNPAAAQAARPPAFP
jgi:hypothetical protein